MLLIQTEPGFYSAASFLDDRVLTPTTKGRWSPLARVEQAMARAPAPLPLHVIFHAGHVGSTLVSRLLDETGLVLPLREPLLLRTLAQMQDEDDARFDAMLALSLKLWRRGFPETRAIILKATSSAARVAEPLLAAAPQMRAIYLNLAPEPYLAALLAGENTPVDLQGMGEERRARLAAYLGADLPPLATLSLGELTALTWAAERLTQARLCAAYPARVRAVDFDAFLTDVPAHMADIVVHFGLAAPPDYLAAIGASPALARYSKATEHAFSPAARQATLDDARIRHAGEIKRGLAWLERLGAACPEAAAAL